MTNTPAVEAAPAATGDGTPVTCGHEPRQRTKPTAMSANIDTMKM